ncbi:MAG: hypothetical protein RSF75_00475 [Acidaminococcaceae bacterium]
MLLKRPLKTKALLPLLLGSLLLGSLAQAAEVEQPLNETKLAAPVVAPEPALKGIVVFDEKVQKGEELAVAYGDVDNDGQEEEIVLLGNKITPTSNYDTQLYILCKDGKTGNVKSFIRPTVGGGYNCSLRLADLTGSGAQNVILVAPTGGSGGIVSYRIFDFAEPTGVREIFGEAENHGVSVSGKYLDDYQVQLTLTGLDKTMTLPLATDLGFYHYLGIYDTKGKLLQTDLRPYIQYLSALTVLDVNDDGRSEAITLQRVVGVNNTDTIGYVRTVWQYAAGTWQKLEVDFSGKLTASALLMQEPVIGGGGYRLSSQQVQYNNSQIVYPYFSNLNSKKLQWQINKIIEDYVSSELTSVAAGGHVELAYTTKYIGRNVVSFVVRGNKAVQGKQQEILKTFNLNLAQGTVIPIGEFLKDSKKMHKSVEEITTRLGQLVLSDLNNYYFDGENLVFCVYDEEKTTWQELKVAKKDLKAYYIGDSLENKTD